MPSVRVIEVVRGGKTAYEVVIIPNNLNTGVKTIGGKFSTKSAAERYIKQHGGRQKIARKAFPKR